MTKQGKERGRKEKYISKMLHDGNLTYIYRVVNILSDQCMIQSLIQNKNMTYMRKVYHVMFKY